MTSWHGSFFCITVNKILIKIQNFSFTKIHLKILFAQLRLFCPGGYELNPISPHISRIMHMVWTLLCYVVIRYQSVLLISSRVASSALGQSWLCQWSNPEKIWVKNYCMDPSKFMKTKDNLFLSVMSVLHINGLVQERCNSIANALELHLSCAHPSIWYNHNKTNHN